MASIIKPVRRPGCFGKMYDLGEEYMYANCIGCRAFNECKDIGYGNDEIPASVLIPEEPSTDHEYLGRW